MAYNIIKHRRGTSQEWLERPDLIPEDGELIIEELHNGLRRCKIGDGVSSFKALPYLEEASITKIINELDTLKKSFSNSTSKVEASLLEKHSKLRSELLLAISDVDIKLEKDKTGLASLLQEEATTRAESIAELSGVISDVENFIEDSIQPSIAKLSARVTSTESAININKATHRAEVQQLRKDFESSAQELENQLISSSSATSDSLAKVKAELIEDYINRISNAAILLEASIQQVADTSKTNTAATADVLRAEITNSVSAVSTSVSKNLQEARAELAAADLSLTNTISDIQQQLEAHVSEVKLKLEDLQKADEKLEGNEIVLLNKIYSNFNLLQDKISELSSSLTSLSAEHTEDYTELRGLIEQVENASKQADTTIIDTLQEHITQIYLELTDLVDDDIVILKTLYSFRAELSNAINEFKDSFNEDILSDLRLELDQYTDTVESLNSELSDIKPRISALEALTAEFEDIMSTLDSIVQENAEENLEKLEQLKGTLEASIAQLQQNVEALSQRVETNAVAIESLGEELTSQAERISNLVRLEDNSDIGYVELEDARSGAYGKVYNVVGDYLRDIERGLKQHVKTDAVTGLFYDETGELNSERPYTLYLTHDEGKILPNTGVQIISGAGGGEGGGSSLSLNYITTSPVILTKDDKEKTILRFRFSGKDSSGDEILQVDASWKIDGVTREYGTVEAGDNEFDVTKYLKEEGTTEVILTVTDAGGMRFATKQWNVRKIDLSIQSSFDDKQKQPAGKDIIFKYTPNGAINKTAIFKLDGEELDRVELLSDISGQEQRYIIPAQTHGAHLLDVYLVADIPGKTEPVPSEHILKDILCYDPSNGSPIIGAATQKLTAKQYETVNIIYTVYDPSTDKPEVTIEAGGSVYTNTIDANPDYDNTPTAIYPFRSDVVGTHTVKIICRGVEKVITITVDKLDINISPLEIKPVFNFDPAGRSNSDLVNRLWSDGDVRMTVSNNFDWTNGGYIPDDPDGPCFCIKAGSSATIDYRLFADDAKVNGKEVKLIFKTKNVADPDAVFLECLDNTTAKNHIGIQMGVHEAKIYGQNGNLELAYSEEDVIEFEFNISSKTDEIPMVMGYEDGVPSRPMIYTDDYSFTQNTPKEITLGSASCDLYIYRFRVYDVSLTAEEILHNFILDARTADEMISRYTRNQIYNENTKLDPDVLAQKCPWLRVYKLSAPHFTNNKSDKVSDTTIQQIYKNGDPILDNWICYNAKHSGQGTSSNNYGAAGRNLDFIMNDSSTYFVLGDGNSAVKDEDKVTTNKITLTRESVPVDYLNAKVNIASSNNLTNAILANRYNRFNPYKRPFVARDGINTDFIKDTMEFYNCVIFVQESDPNINTHREFTDTNWHFYAIGNIGDSKKTDETRKTDINDPYECCVEIMDVELPLSDFPVDTMINAMSYVEDDKTHQRAYRWAKDENLDILYEAQFALTDDTEINLNKIYYIDLPVIVAAAPEQQTIENLENLYERKYELTDDLTLVKDKVYYLDALGTLATKEYLQGIDNPKNAGLYEWRRKYQKTNDTEIVQNKFYYVEVLQKTNAMSYTYEDVETYLWAKNENLDILYEFIDGEYVITEDREVDVINKTYYIRVEERDADDNIIDVKYQDAMSHYTEQKKVYTHATTENLSLGKLYEITYYPTTDTIIDLTKTYYVDILEQDDFSEEFTYGWRYISNKKDNSIVSVCKQAWIDFYRFITQSTDDYFKAHFEDYFVKDSALYYYLFTTRYCMVDNRAKNTFWHFGKTGNYHVVSTPNDKMLSIYCELIEGEYVATQDTSIDHNKTYYSQYAFDLCWDYDNDTSLGLNNYGKQVYRYGLEDIDVDAAGDEVFREMGSTFFCRVRDNFTEDLKKMYNDLESLNAWHAKSFIDECDNWQNEFPEELWRLDINRKYIRTYNSSFIDGKGDTQFLTNMANGRMKYHRRQWERSQEQYMASKYQTSTAYNDSAVLRCSVPSGSLAVEPNYRLSLTPYAYMYLNVKYGTGNPIQVRATTPGKAIEIPFSGNGADIIAIYNSSLIQDFGDLSACYVNTIDTTKAHRIRKLILGNTTTGYTNPGFTTLTTGANPLLEELNVTNVTGLDQSLDLRELVNLRRLYASGTKTPSVLFATGGKLEDVELSEVNNITLRRLSNLDSSDLDLSSYDNVVDLIVEDCPHIDVANLLGKCVKLIRARLVNVNLGELTYESFKTKMKNFELKGIGATGETINDAFVEGTIHYTDNPLTGEQYNEVISHYPELNITYEKLESVLKFMRVDGELEYEPARQVVVDGGNGLDPVAGGMIEAPHKDSTAEFDYEFVGWSTQENVIIEEDQVVNKEELDALAFNCVKGDRRLYPVFREVLRSYTVRFVNPADKDAVVYQMTVQYGTNAEFPESLEATLSKKDSGNPDNYVFTGWIPGTENITADRTCYAQFAFNGNWHELSSTEIVNGEGEDIEYGYEIENNKLSITKVYPMLSENSAVKIPESLKISDATDGLLELDVGYLSGFEQHAELELILLPASLLELRSDAFKNCYNLEKVEFETAEPELTHIREAAFKSCSNLKSITIPESVTSIGNSAFYGCSSLADIVLPDSVTTLGNYAFQGCTSLSHVKISNNITILNRQLLQGCTGLISIELPPRLETVGYSCFSGCRNLESISLPEGLKTISVHAFDNCSSLSTIHIPSTVTNIQEAAFYNSTGLSEVVFEARKSGSKLTIVGDNNGKDTPAFKGTSGVTFRLPWNKGIVAGAPWGATSCTLVYNDVTVKYDAYGIEEVDHD